MVKELNKGGGKYIGKQDEWEGGRWIILDGLVYRVKLSALY